jgi:beta-glucosidase-like glycosyl hydrolase
MVDIARDPRWGRIVEGAGEDPFLGGVMAAAQVRGFQGDSASLAGPTPPPTDVMLATVKHFAAYGGAEGGRDYNTVDVSERTLWETYLPPFEAAVRAGAATLMPSFNEIGGTPSHASRWLLGDVLRGRWGFDGVVVSDWTGVAELIPHGLGDSATVAARALGAGVDVEMSSTLYRTQMAEAVRQRQVSPDAIDAAVTRVLRAKYALGLFDDPYRYSDAARERQVTLRPEHRAAARALAREAVVLLENRPTAGAPTLPLRRTRAARCCRTSSATAGASAGSSSATGPGSPSSWRTGSATRRPWRRARSPPASTSRCRAPSTATRSGRRCAPGACRRRPSTRPWCASSARSTRSASSTTRTATATAPASAG